MVPPSSSSGSEVLSLSLLKQRAGLFLASEEAEAFVVGEGPTQCLNATIIPLYLERVMGIFLLPDEWDAIFRRAMAECSKRPKRRVGDDTGSNFNEGPGGKAAKSEDDAGSRRRPQFSAESSSGVPTPPSSARSLPHSHSGSNSFADSSGSQARYVLELETKLAQFQKVLWKGI